MEVSEVVLIAWLDCHITSNVRTAITGLFPLVLLANGVSSGAPGADRCVAAYDQTTGNCDLVGAMTHNGVPPNSRPNAFVLCV
jgi:hypothetical protein